MGERIISEPIPVSEAVVLVSGCVRSPAVGCGVFVPPIQDKRHIAHPCPQNIKYMGFMMPVCRSRGYSFSLGVHKADRRVSYVETEEQNKNSKRRENPPQPKFMGYPANFLILCPPRSRKHPIFFTSLARFTKLSVLRN